MNKILVKIGSQFYEMDKLSLKLEPVDTPENVEELDFFDGSKIAGYVDSSYDGTTGKSEVVDKFNSKVKAFKAEKKKAQTRDDIKAVQDLKPELAVFQHFIEEKKALAAELDVDIDVQDTDTEPETEPDNEPPTGGDTPPPAEQPQQTPPEDQDKEPDTGAPDSEPLTPEIVVTDEELNALLEEEGVTAEELVKQASIIVKNNRSNGPVTRVGETLNSRTKRVYDQSLTRRNAPFVTASIGAYPGQEIDTSNVNDFVSKISETWNRAFFSGSGVAANHLLGTFRELNTPATRLADGFDRLEIPNAYPVRTASSECEDVDTRNSLVTCDNLDNDLTGLFAALATDDCNVRFRKDISMWKLAPGITYWSKKRYADYCSARDELNAAVAAASDPATSAELAAIAALQAKFLTLQKRCADVGCLEYTDPITWESISACLDYSKRQEMCSDMEIRRHLELLEKLYLRARNSHMMAFIDSCAATVEVDMCEWGGLDACHIVDEVVDNVISKTDEKERRTSSDNWVGIAESRFMKFLSSGPRKGGSYCNGNEGYSKTSIEGLSNVVTSVDNYAQLNVDTGELDLIPVPEQLGDAYPEPGTTIDYATQCQYKDEWTLYVIDPSEGFTLRKPDIRLEANFNHESAKGNWVNGPFMESHVGYVKDGCSPWYKFVFKNAYNSGARYADVPAQTICPEAAGAPQLETGEQLEPAAV